MAKISEVTASFEKASRYVHSLPPGDVFSEKSILLDKAHRLLVFADAKLSEGHHVNDIIDRINELITEIMT